MTITTNSTLAFYSGGFNGSIHVLDGGLVYLWGAPSAFNGSSVILETGAQWQSFYNAGVEPVNNAVTLNGVAHIVVGDHDMLYTNLINGPGGFVMDYYNHAMILSAADTYTGPTIIGSSGNSVEIALTNNGSISDSSLIFFGGTNSDVAHIDVTGRPDQTLTLASGQTLAGIGGINGSLVVSPGATISPAGTNTTIGITTGTNAVGALAASDNIALNGTTLITLDGSGTNSAIDAAGNITYGGLLNLVNISGSPLAAGNSFQIFSAASYTGSFATITPATPGSGLVWDTSALDSSGVLSVIAGASGPAISNNTSLSDGNLIFSGTGGTAGGSFYVLTTTNLDIPLTNWVTLSTNSFGANGSFSVTNAVTPGTPQQFYRIEEAP